MSILLSDAQAQAIRQAIGGCQITAESFTNNIRTANLTGAQMDTTLNAIDTEVDSARSTIFIILEEAQRAT